MDQRQTKKESKNGYKKAQQLPWLTGKAVALFINSNQNDEDPLEDHASQTFHIPTILWPILL